MQAVRCLSDVEVEDFQQPRTLRLGVKTYLRPRKTYVVFFAMCPPKCRPGAPKTPPRRSRDAPETPSAVSWLSRRHFHALWDDFGVKTVPKWSPNGASIHRKFTSIRRPRSESKFACFPTGPLRSYIFLQIRKSRKSLVRVINIEGVAFSPQALGCDRN